MKEAKLILQRLMRRHLYKLVGLKRISCTEVGLSKLVSETSFFIILVRLKQLSSRVVRAPASGGAHSGLIPSWVKLMTLELALRAFPLDAQL